jgi:NADH-quinone oxidoreductase subunit C
MPPSPPLQHIDPETNLAVQRVRAQFPQAVEGASAHRDQVTLRVYKEYVVEVCQFLRDDPELSFEMCLDVTAVDYPMRPRRFDVVYHLYSLSKGRLLRVKAAVGEAEEIDSVVPVWKTANWLERETYDMYGVRFANHPDLRRILLTDNFEGYPFRKDYPLAGY